MNKVFLGQKILQLHLTLFIILTLNFAIPRFMPGDPVISCLGPDAAVISGQDFAALSSQFGLDKPLHEQYAAYWRSLLAGDLGYSFHYRVPVLTVIGEHIAPTLLLLAPSLLLSSLLAVSAGCCAGWKAGFLTDSVLTLLALVIYATPQFLVAMLLVKYLGFTWGLLPTSGISSGLAGSGTEQLYDLACHLILPVTVLSLSAAAGKFLVMRSSVVAFSQAAFVTYARAKGLPERRILFLHVLKNACLPFLSLVALHLGFIVSGALVVEIVFSINGMGSLIYEAALHRDYPVLQGCFLLLTLLVIGVNAATDILYRLLDPRILP